MARAHVTWRNEPKEASRAFTKLNSILERDEENLEEKSKESVP